MTVLPFAGRFPARAALLASAVLLGVVCIHAWNILAGAHPGTSPGTAVSAQFETPADPAALHLFGQSDGAQAPAQAAAPPPNFTLIGVIAARPGRPAVALLMIDGKPQALRPGDDLAAGWVLREVQADRVILDQGGARTELLLPAARNAVPNSGGIVPVGAAPGVPPGLRGNGPGAPMQPFKLEVQGLGPNHLGFSKAELSRGLQDPRQAASLGRATPAAGGGLTLDDVPSGSLPDRIGLHSGDVLRLANGQALNNLTDLPRLYQEFGSAAEVRLEITRAGQPTILQYTMRP